MATITRRRDLLPRRFLEMFDEPERWFSEPTMRVEEYLDDGQLVVKADMPGIDPDEDVEITVHDGVLEIRGERRQTASTDDKDGYRTEVRYGMFRRAIRLPAGAGESDVTATYRDGVLEVRLPVAGESTGATKVPITRS